MATATTTTAAPPPAKAGPLYIDTQHDDMVHDAQLDYYGCKLATSSSDRTIKIYNISGDSNYEHTATLQGHQGPVWQVSWAHPKFGVILASASFDGTVLIHREQSSSNWTLLHAATQLHQSSVNGLAFAPPSVGLVLATASSDGKVAILKHEPNHSWSVQYIQDNALGVNSISWAPESISSTSSSSNGTDEASPAPLQQFVTAGCDNRIRFYQFNAELNEYELKTTCGDQHSDWVRDVAWAPPILPNTHMVASCAEDCTCVIWTKKDDDGTADGDESTSTWKPTLLHTFDAPVWRVSWSLTGQMLAVSSGENDVSLWKAGLDGTWSRMAQVDQQEPSVEVAK